MGKLIKNYNQLDFLKWAAVFFAFSFGLGIALNSVGFGLFCSIGIIYCVLDYINGETSFKKNNVLFLIIAYFVWVCIREVIINFTEAYEIVFYYLAFFLIPIICLFQSNRLVKHLNTILIAFLIGMVLNIIVNLGFGIYRGILIKEQGVNFWYFTYNFLSEPFGIQPIYLGYFYVIALLILLYFKRNIKNQVLFYFVLALLVMGVFLLAARNAILSMLFLLPLFLFLTKKISIKNGFLLLTVFVICFIGALQNPVVKNRILKAANKGNFYSGTSLRANIWKSALSASKNDFMWGSGEEAASVLLLKEYRKRDLKVPLKYKYHSHNQFLHTLVQYGLVGTVLLIALFFVVIFTTWKTNNYLGFVITLLFLFTMMTEAIFTRQWGGYSYVFFTSLLLMNVGDREN